jgi:poly(3-hydroxybutyrate) depolymerase
MCILMLLHPHAADHRDARPVEAKRTTIGLVPSSTKIVTRNKDLMIELFARASRQSSAGNPKGPVTRCNMTCNMTTVPALPFYLLHELQHAGMQPVRFAIEATRHLLQIPINPFGATPWARSAAAACEMFERATRRYGKPAWDISSTSTHHEADRAPFATGGIAIEPRVVWQRPFCRLIHFARVTTRGDAALPKILLVAPMSGHHATLVRGTVEALLPGHDVHVTDWVDARMVPVSDGRFDLDDYIDYVIAMLRVVGADTHVVAVCQPGVPVLAAVSLMEARNDSSMPLSMTLLASPIDTRQSPTAVNRLAERKGIDWFRRNVIHVVPPPYPGALRQVYPGFLQLGGFMSMNLDRHLGSHRDMFIDLVRGDGESADRHRAFYDEYLAVMDLTAEFFLQTVQTIFIDQALATGTMVHHGEAVEPGRIRHAALLTIEGEVDDITGRGQTEAAHRLCAAIPHSRKSHHLQPGAGHYGVFNGSRFRADIAPRIAQFIRAAARRDTRARRRPNAAGPVLPASLRRLVRLVGPRRPAPPQGVHAA